MSVDPPEKSSQVVQNQRLPFHILCDTERKVTRAYGVVHEGGGPGGTDIALPAYFLVGSDGRIVWKFVAGNVAGRPEVEAVMREIEKLSEDDTPAKSP